MARNNARAFSLFSAFAPLSGFRFGVHFDRPDDIEGGGSGGGGGGGGDLPAVPAAPVVPAAAPAAPHNEQQRLINERNKAKKAFRGVLTALGINYEQVRVEGGNGGTPMRFVSTLDNSDLTPKLQGAAAFIAGGGGGTRRGGNAADSVALATANAENTSLKKRNEALIAFVKRTAVIEPLRAACVRHHAVDDDNGLFSDIVGILSPLFAVDVSFDEDNETAEPTITVTPMQNNAPLINAATNAPHTPDTLVSDFLNKKPKFKTAQYRQGPGAGGARVGNAGGNGNRLVTVPSNGNQPQEPGDYTAAAVADFFGVPASRLPPGVRPR